MLPAAPSPTPAAITAQFSYGYANMALTLPAGWAYTADTYERGLKVGALWAKDGVYELADGWAGQGPEGIAGLLDNDVHRALVRDGAALPPDVGVILSGGNVDLDRLPFGAAPS